MGRNLECFWENVTRASNPAQESWEGFPEGGAIKAEIRSSEIKTKQASMGLEFKPTWVYLTMPTP